jgi:2-polyprenyl-3-methyl-5-hydroxy-6-metoxy-1,4-benzoquinol methylase
MRSLIAAWLLIALQTASAFGQPGPGNQDTDNQIRRQAERYFNAFEHRDAKTLDELLFDQCLLSYPRGVVESKAKLLENVRKAKAVDKAAPTTNTLRDVSVRRIGDTAVLNATVATKRADTPEYAYRRTLTWARQDGRWRLLNDQWSMLGEALESEYWSGFFRGNTDENFNRKPNPLLVWSVTRLPPGKALDVGVGQGRNAIYLAKRGWDVTGIDRAEGALAVSRQYAKEQGVRITPVLQSAEEFDWGHNRWDLIVMVYFLGVRENAAKVRESLKPEGLVVIEAFIAEPGKPSGGVVFQRRELGKYFNEGFEILRYQENEIVADFGEKRQPMVRFVARKLAETP